MIKLNMEQGRSMVETLSILAIIGVLSLGGVQVYKVSMNRHIANELLNEAFKRATVLATKAATNQKIDNDAIREFPNSAEAKRFSVHHEGKQFTLSTTGVDEDVCKQMQNMVGSESSIQKIECDIDNSTLSLTFDDDLSYKKAFSDISSANGRAEDDDSNCSNDTKPEGNECQVCFSGSYIDSDAVCQKLHPGEKRMCIDGQCIVPEDSELGGCTYNSDCTGVVDGIDCDSKTCFCNYLDPNRDWGDGDIFPGIRSGEYNPDKGSGVCVEAKYSSLRAEPDGITEIVSNDNLDWFSAKNFCAALKMRMISANDINITLTKLGEYFEENGECNFDQGTISGANTCSTEGSPYRPQYPNYNFWIKDLYPFENYLTGIHITRNVGIHLTSPEFGGSGNDINALCIK